MNAVDEENRRAFATLGKGDPSVSPLEAAFLSADQVGELVDALACERIVGSGSGEDRPTGQQNLAPRSFAFVVLLHTPHFALVKEKARLLESNRASGTAHGGQRIYLRERPLDPPFLRP